MTTTAADVWTALSEPWKLAFGQAWASFVTGNLGIGAVLVDPSTGEIVAEGRNRVAEPAREPGTIAGNFLAHAEMNAFASMPRFRADGLDLYTTLEPCLMCAATSVFLHVERTFYAVADEYFSGLDDLWDHHEYSRDHKPVRSAPLDPMLSGFARILPLTVQAAWTPDSRVMVVAMDRVPALASLAEELAADRVLFDLAETGVSVDGALETIWLRLHHALGPE